MSVNKVILLGYVSKFQEVQIRKTQAGKKIASFTLSTPESWKDSNGEKKTKYENHRIVIFSEGLAGVVEKYVHHGDQLYIEGALQTRKWTDSKGVDKYTTEVVLQGFNSKLEIVNSQNNQSENAEPQVGSEVSDLEDIPF